MKGHKKAGGLLGDVKERLTVAKISASFVGKSLVELKQLCSQKKPKEQQQMGIPAALSRDADHAGCGSRRNSGQAAQRQQNAQKGEETEALQQSPGPKQNKRKQVGYFGFL